MISVDTKLVALLGTPLRQSFSTRMQNAAYEANGLDYEYFPIESGPEDLEAIVNGIRHMNFAGFGVTKPDKIAIIPYLDELDPLAEKMGAVNTVVIKDGKLIGYNTDGEGGVRILQKSLNMPLTSAACFSFGAGGCARALCYTLADKGARALYITDLFDSAAETLANEINAKFAPIATFIPFEDKAQIRERFQACDIVMNNSGLGMAPHLTESPIEADAFLPTHLAFDATYNPAKTQFLKDAEAKGATILNGLGMLVNQGAIQFKLWTGKEEPVDIMMATVQDIMNESK